VNKAVLTLVTISIAMSCGHAKAQQDCRALNNNMERLACYDRASGYAAQSATPSDTPTDAQPSDTSPAKSTPDEPSWLKYFQVRDQGTANQAGKDPATFSASRNKGEDVSLIQAAVIWSGPPLNAAGWQPFGSVAINRNTLSKSATDVRSGAMGLTGTIFDYYESGFAIWATLSGSAREDQLKRTASNTVTSDNYVVIRGLDSGIPFKADSNEFNFFPRIGLQYEDQHEVASGSAPGTYHAYFWGARASFWPGRLSDRVQITGTYLRFHDFSTSNGLAERHDSYAKLSIDYYLLDPLAENAWLQPVIGIEREVGDNPITGSLGNNRTTLAFKLKIN
jgi:hypothetical protein